MTYSNDWRGWPPGWDRTNPFRVVNFLGKTGANTHQNVKTSTGRIIYFCRRGDTGVLEIRFDGRMATALPSLQSYANTLAPNAYADVDWPPRWPDRKMRLSVAPWRELVRVALKIANI